MISPTPVLTKQYSCLTEAGLPFEKPFTAQGIKAENDGIIDPILCCMRPLRLTRKRHTLISFYAQTDAYDRSPCEPCSARLSMPAAETDFPCENFISKKKHHCSGYTLSYELTTSPTAPKESIVRVHTGQPLSLVKPTLINNPNDSSQKKASLLGA